MVILWPWWGDNQRIGKHWSQYGGCYTAVDLLASLSYDGSTQKNRFTTHFLTQTHRNSNMVEKAVNFFLGVRQQLGISTVIKGADCYLNGHNGARGEGGIVIVATNVSTLNDLRTRFIRNPEVAIIVPASDVMDARGRWLETWVFSAADALGLEFPYIICEGLLADEEGSLKVGELLHNASTKAAIAT